MRDSRALARAKKHTYIDDTDGDKVKPRQEGIYLTLDQLSVLIDFLKQNHPHIDCVSFIIGKKSASEGGRPLEGRLRSKGGEDEFTVEVLPFKLSADKKTGEFLTGPGEDGADTIGFLTIPPETPFGNDCLPGEGGNQTIPPPSTGG
ncbi:hypothetical protein [Emticicia fontis]